MGLEKNKIIIYAIILAMILGWIFILLICLGGGRIGWNSTERSSTQTASESSSNTTTWNYKVDITFLLMIVSLISIVLFFMRGGKIGLIFTESTVAQTTSESSSNTTSRNFSVQLW